ncbi:unnamed protein product [Pleuronectes platessa]|uniref:Uncharacterized protein n=1 Tax=Pleuronectes platessa TaxID=8262 RepID=A0A9N7ZBJ1_PLEPL|nr:unnamed protein product [Pleuronectes platessa]
MQTLNPPEVPEAFTDSSDTAVISAFKGTWKLSSMEVLSGPWADLALLLRQTLMHTDRATDSFVPLWLFGLLLFLSVSLLLLQLIIYFSWKLRQVEDDQSGFPQNRSAIHRQMDGATNLRSRSAGSHCHT